MKYMLDTNICIKLMINDSALLNVFKAKSKDGVSISAITLAELEFGVHNSPNRYKENNRNKLITFMPLVAILPYTADIAFEYGFLRADLKSRNLTVGPLDLLIAAHAKSLSLIIATNNVNEFSKVKELFIEDWFTNPIT